MVHVGTNNADKEGTTAILEKYRNLLKKTKQARVGQIIISDCRFNDNLVCHVGIFNYNLLLMSAHRCSVRLFFAFFAVFM